MWLKSLRPERKGKPNTMSGIDARFAEEVRLRGAQPATNWMQINHNKFGARLSEIKKLEVHRMNFFSNTENAMTYVWLRPTPPEAVTGGPRRGSAILNLQAAP